MGMALAERETEPGETRRREATRRLNDPVTASRRAPE